MAKGAKGDAAAWTGDDEVFYLNFLKENAAAAGDGASFKVPTFTAAAALLEARRTKGGPKTAKSCQNKLTQVCVVTCTLLY